MMLSAEGVSVRYGDKPAVQDVSFSIAPGQWWMIVGPNGAGKSTLVEAIARGVPYSGRILWGEREIGSYSSRDYAKKVGILSQTRRTEYAFTVAQVVRLGRYAHQRGFLRGGDAAGPARMEEALRLTGLTGMENRLLTTLSGGEIQRVFLAQVLSQDPRLLILDEPANHLDLKYQQALFSLIGDWLKQGERAVLSVVHDLSLARRYGTHALLLDQGRCAAGGTLPAVMSPDHLKAVYQMDVHAWMRDLLTPWQE